MNNVDAILQQLRLIYEQNERILEKLDHILAGPVPPLQLQAEWWLGHADELAGKPPITAEQARYIARAYEVMSDSLAEIVPEEAGRMRQESERWRARAGELAVEGAHP